MKSYTRINRLFVITITYYFSRLIDISSISGTSASAPLAAGIIALVLQVNPDLSWRDVQHIIVRCAHTANLDAKTFNVNGANRNFSHSFGYGLMDASRMVSSMPINRNNI